MRPPATEKVFGSCVFYNLGSFNSIVTSRSQNGKQFRQAGRGQSQNQQRASETTRKLSGLPGVDESVVQNGNCRDAEERAVHGPNSAEDTGASKNYRCNCEEFVSGARVCF